MVKYEIRIDGAEFNRALTLDELLENGFLDDYDPNIQVRAKGESRWITARDYLFAEKENNSTSGYTINNDGSITREFMKNPKSTKMANTNYRVNEDGSVTRHNIPSSSPTSSSSSDKSSNGSSSNDGCLDGFWKWMGIIWVIAHILLLLGLIG